MVCARPHRNLGILSLEEKTKEKENISCRSGCVTNWYQSMVTALGLLGLMNELRKIPFEVLLKGVTLYSNPLYQKIKLRMKIPIVCMHLKKYELCVDCE